MLFYIVITNPTSKLLNPANSGISRKKFWGELLDYSKGKLKPFSNISPGTGNWISATSGRSGLQFVFRIYKDNASVELYIDRGKEKDLENEEIFDFLVKHSNEINQAFGEELDCDRLEGRRAFIIRKKLEIGGRDDIDKWPEIQKTMVDAMARLEKALQPHFKNLPI